MNDKPIFDILEHKGILREGGEWSREVNVISWDGKDPKIDVREWSEDHERCTRGITLTESEAALLADAISEGLPDTDFVRTASPIREIDDGKLTVSTYKVLGFLGPPGCSGWRKEATITAWNGGKPKVDVREWSPDHRRMSRGIALTWGEAKIFARLDLTIGDDVREKHLTLNKGNSLC